MDARIARALALLLVGLAGMASGSIDARATDASSNVPDTQPSLDATDAARSLLLGLASNEDALFAVGEWGHILETTDGSTWTRRAADTRVTLTAAHFADRDRGWAVGHDAIIVHTDDAGRTWNTQISLPEAEAPLLDVWFEDAEHGIAVGAYGLVFETFDGGTRWEERTIDEQEIHFYDIGAVSDTSLVVAGEFGSAFRSRDGGANWTELEVPYEGTLFGILSLEPEIFLVYGLRGHVLRTEDGGDTWTPLALDTELSVCDGLVRVDGTVVLVGLGGLVCTSRDGGRTFTIRIGSDRRGISSIATLDGRLFVAGEGGVAILESGGRAPEMDDTPETGSAVPENGDTVQEAGRASTEAPE